MAAVTHVGIWTEADLAELPDDGQRRELLEGALVVNPPPSGRHQNAAFGLTRTLREAAPPELLAVEALGVRVPGGSVLIPDIVVADRAAVLSASSGVLEPAVVVLAVEIVSPSSLSMDRLTKPVLYAQAGIETFWRVELDDGPTVQAHRLANGAYVLTGSGHPGQPLRADRPFPVLIDPADLV